MVAFGIGMWIGVTMGYLLAACLIIGKRADEVEDELKKMSRMR